MSVLEGVVAAAFLALGGTWLAEFSSTGFTLGLLLSVYLLYISWRYDSRVGLGMTFVFILAVCLTRLSSVELGLSAVLLLLALRLWSFKLTTLSGLFQFGLAFVSFIAFLWLLPAGALLALWGLLLLQSLGAIPVAPPQQQRLACRFERAYDEAYRALERGRAMT